MVEFMRAYGLLGSSKVNKNPEQSHAEHFNSKADQSTKNGLETGVHENTQVRLIQDETLL